MPLYRADGRRTPDGHGFALAIDDCSNAIKLDPSIAKLWYRRAVAHKGLGGQTSLRSALEGELKSD